MDCKDVERLQNPLKDFVREELKKLINLTKALEQGAYLTHEQLNLITRALFRVARGKYVGVDSNIPSKYFKIYPGYLQEHASYPYPSTRILLIPHSNALHNDAIRHPKEVQEFLAWHVEHGVNLKYIHRSVALATAKKLGLPSTDVGFWEESFAVAFRPGERVWVRLIRKEDPLFRLYAEYIKELLRKAEDVREVENIIFSKQLVRIWDEYVGDRKEFHKFLGDVLTEKLPRRNSVILDVGAGLGKEVEYLVKEGFMVEANEVDREFNKVLKKRLKGVTIYSVDWRKMEDIGKKYGALLCVGNSLSMLEPSERTGVIKKFYDMLVEDGILILDIRNYGEMLKLLERGPMWKNEIMRRLGWRDYMYKGNVRLKKEDDSVLFEFYDREGNFIGDIKTFPIYKEEVIRYLEEAGFRKIEVYGDMDDVERPAYYQFVAIR